MKFLSYDSRSNEKVNSGQIKVIWINHDNFKKWPRFGEVIEPFISQSKWGAPSRWSFRPISTWGSIETMTMRKTHPILLTRKGQFSSNNDHLSTEILNNKNISLVYEYQHDFSCPNTRPKPAWNNLKPPQNHKHFQKL